ncbi:hypothetical protein JYU11_00065 [bacterium AH-315-G05]|nr:hypothetical protein [bacterium AH-315-L21]MBN4069282.1 hypothetical protein [bacterium AH-315-G05]
MNLKKNIALVIVLVMTFVLMGCATDEVNTDEVNTDESKSIELPAGDGAPAEDDC